MYSNSIQISQVHMVVSYVDLAVDLSKSSFLIPKLSNNLPLIIPVIY